MISHREPPRHNRVPVDDTVLTPNPLALPNYCRSYTTFVLSPVAVASEFSVSVLPSGETVYVIFTNAFASFLTVIASAAGPTFVIVTVHPGPNGVVHG